MLRYRLLQLLFVLAVLAAATGRLPAAEIPDDSKLSSLSTSDLIELVDETDFDDPFEAHHHLAIRAINELLGRDLNDEQEAAAHYRLAVYNLRTNSLEAAMKEIDLALHFAPDEPEFLLMKGSLLFDSGKAGEGTAFARKALTSDPELIEAQQSYTALAGRAVPTDDDRLLLIKAGPLLPMLVHPYLKAATAFAKADDYRSSIARVAAYLKVAPFDFQRSDDAYMLYVVASSKIPVAEGEQQAAAQELVRRSVLAWNLMKSETHRDEIFRSLVRAVHFAYGTKSPGTVLALSETVLAEGKLQQRSLAAVRYVRAKALAGLGRYSEALGEIDQAIAADTDDTDARALKVEYLTWTGQYGGALRECDQILKLNPDHISTLLLKAQILTGCPDAKFRDAKAAIKLASRACEVARQKQKGELFNPYKMLVLASAEAGDFQSAGEAVKQLRFTADSVEDVKAVEQLANHIRDHKPWNLDHPVDNSKQPRHKLLYQQLLLSQPNLQLPELQANYEQRCDELLAMKELSASERTYCLRRRALCRFWQGKLDPAIADIQELLTSTPKDYPIYVLLNRAFLEKRDEKGAALTATQLQNAGDGSKDFAWTRDVVQTETDLYRVENGTFQTPGEREQLVKQLNRKIERMIGQTPQQPVLYQFRAACRYHQGDYAAAVEDSQKCLDLAPYRSRNEFAGVVYQYARILEKLYRVDPALHCAAMVVHLEGKTDRSRRLVSEIYRATGRHQLADLWDVKPASAKAQPAVAESTAPINR